MSETEGKGENVEEQASTKQQNHAKQSEKHIVHTPVKSKRHDEQKAEENDGTPTKIKRTESTEDAKEEQQTPSKSKATNESEGDRPKGHYRSGATLKKCSTDVFCIENKQGQCNDLFGGLLPRRVRESRQMRSETQRSLRAHQNIKKAISSLISLEKSKTNIPAYNHSFIETSTSTTCENGICYLT